MAGDRVRLTKTYAGDDHDPKEIWLAPECEGCAYSERTWCQDQGVYYPCEECGREPTKYLLAPDQCAGRAALAEAEGGRDG